MPINTAKGADLWDHAGMHYGLVTTAESLEEAAREIKKPARVAILRGLRTMGIKAIGFWVAWKETRGDGRFRDGDPEGRHHPIVSHQPIADRGGFLVREPTAKSVSNEAFERGCSSPKRVTGFSSRRPG